MSVELTALFINQYFGEHINTAPHEHYENAEDLIEKVNEVLALFVADGGKLHTNPSTDGLLAGSGSGGYRPEGSTVGATHSKHKTGQAVDVYDPHRELAAWCLAHPAVVHQQLGLSIERPEWTPTWVHFQSVPPGSGVFAFIPDASPPKAPPINVA